MSKSKSDGDEDDGMSMDDDGNYDVGDDNGSTDDIDNECTTGRWWSRLIMKVRSRM